MTDRSTSCASGDAVVELRALPPPQAVQARFDRGYTLLEQLVDALRRLAATGPVPDTAADTSPSSVDGDVAGLLGQIPHLEIGLERCALNPLR